MIAWVGEGTQREVVEKNEMLVVAAAEEVLEIVACSLVVIDEELIVAAATDVLLEVLAWSLVDVVDIALAESPIETEMDTLGMIALVEVDVSLAGGVLAGVLVVVAAWSLLVDVVDELVVAAGVPLVESPTETEIDTLGMTALVELVVSLAEVVPEDVLIDGV